MMTMCGMFGKLPSKRDFVAYNMPRPFLDQWEEWLQSAVAASRHELVGVVTRPDAPSGRGRKLVASPVAQRAEDLGVPVLKPEHPRDPDFQAALADLRPDACPVVAYGALLPQAALDLVPYGWINLHFSVLPAWRGAAPVQHALWAGDEVTGATTFRIVKELDAGPVFGVMTERIRPDDTSGDLLARLSEGGAGLLVQTLDGIEDGTLEARAQQEEGVSFAPKILVDDAPRRLVYRIIRGLPVSHHRGEILLSDNGRGGTTLEWDIQMASPVPGLARAVTGGLERALKQSLRKLATVV